MPTPRPLPALLVAIVLTATLGVTACGSDSDETTSARTGPAAAEDGARKAGETKAPVGVRAEVCESDETADGELRVTGVDCELGRRMVKAWRQEDRCAAPPGASRTSCKVGGFTCLGTSTGRGLAVFCAAPGQSIVFIAKQS